MRTAIRKAGRRLPMLSLALTGMALVTLAVRGDVGAGSPESGFTLADALHFPYAIDLVAAPHAARVAWEVMDDGKRSLWTAAAPEFLPRRLASWPDDGQ